MTGPRMHSTEFRAPRPCSLPDGRQAGAKRGGQNTDKNSLDSGFSRLSVRDKRALGSEVEHGGNIYKLAEELGVAESKIIDFSASVNPLGISKKVKLEITKEINNLHNYPDPDTKRLREELSLYYDIAPETILCSNGSTELIYLLPRALRPKKVLIPSPTFSEYEKAVVRTQSTGSKTQIKYLVLKEGDDFEIKPHEFIKAMRGCDMAFLCNPNNPTGKLLGKNSVLEIAEAAKELKCFLIVDEAFIDFHPEDSIIKVVQDNPYLIVLRSMTKFYALTGLRIGYGIFSAPLSDKLKEFKEPWTVNSLAQKAAIAAIRDNDYADRTFRLIKSGKDFFESSFRKIGIEFFPSDTNFYLLKTKSDIRIDLKLREKGILVRNCSNFRGLNSSYIRVAVKSRKGNKILIEAVKHTLSK